ncbi:hypothetical protein [Micromonospora sp. HM5-17]|jgi:hypothetical protein|uniref:hypothetical protein n=1 Tax=Micromonospora sp. HM5-17 TaxID=2487710 RepID=UPI000F48B22D|nr:hypothetical protein [Micromonospora sp. HM5-17]ROT32163.1 hypothetical protein EF879_11185 [Micromonospora sp. HM5-17]
MSVSLLLVPVALAAATTVAGLASGRDDDGRVVCEVQTRMRDENLLAAALRETGAAVTVRGHEIAVAWQGVQATFRRDQNGIWTASFTGEVDESRAIEIVRAVDAGYGRQVQRAVLDRLRERAPAAGLRLESEQTMEDEAVRLVFAVREGVRGAG